MIKMGNIFLEKKKESGFSWGDIGDIEKGRLNLGEEMPVLVYRLFQYTMRSTLEKELGKETMIHVFREAGRVAGTEFANNVLDLSLDMDNFIAQLQKMLVDLKIGIMRIEKFDPETGSAVLTIGEDLDCSGLPISGETVCNYDEGFLAGVLSAYTKKSYDVIEVDCWATGDRVCRFEANVKN